jgi:GT2 family glycosyltransferase
MFDCSVVIPTYRRPEMLVQLLDSLQDSSLPPEEVVVINEDPHHELERLPALDFPIKVIESRTGGGNLAEARNAGWRASSGDLIFFVDDDNVVGSSALKVLRDIARVPAVGVVAPVSYTASVPDFVWCGGIRRSMWTTKTTFLYHGLSHLPDAKLWETADMPNAFALRRSVLERVGGFDAERFPTHYDEADLMMRVRQLGFRCVVARDAGVFHQIDPDTSAGGVPTKELQRMLTHGGPRRVALSGRSRARFHGIYGTRAQRVISRSLFIPVWALVSTLACLRAPTTVRTRWIMVRSLWSGLLDGYRSDDHSKSVAHWPTA